VNVAFHRRVASRVKDLATDNLRDRRRRLLSQVVSLWKVSDVIVNTFIGECVVATFRSSSLDEISPFSPPTQIRRRQRNGSSFPTRRRRFIHLFYPSRGGGGGCRRRRVRKTGFAQHLRSQKKTAAPKKLRSSLLSVSRTRRVCIIYPRAQPRQK